MHVNRTVEHWIAIDIINKNCWIQFRFIYRTRSLSFTQFYYFHTFVGGFSFVLLQNSMPNDVTPIFRNDSNNFCQSQRIWFDTNQRFVYLWFLRILFFWGNFVPPLKYHW